MSGSGPTVFGLFRDAERARLCQQRGAWFEATDRVLRDPIARRAHGQGILGRRLMVGQRPLEPCVEVRILPPQPDDLLLPPDGGAGLESLVPPPQTAAHQHGSGDEVVGRVEVVGCSG